MSRARAALRDRSSASSRISWRKCSSVGLPRVSMPMTRLRATRGGRPSRRRRRRPWRAWCRCRSERAGGVAEAQAAHRGAQGGLVGGVGGGGPDAGAGGGDRVGRGDLREQGLEAVDPVLVLVQDVGEVRVRGLVGDRVDGAPGGQGGDRHLGHQGQGLVAVEGAGEEVGGLDEEGEGAAAQASPARPGGRDSTASAMRSAANWRRSASSLV